MPNRLWRAGKSLACQIIVLSDSSSFPVLLLAIFLVLFMLFCDLLLNFIRHNFAKYIGVSLKLLTLTQSPLSNKNVPSSQILVTSVYNTDIKLWANVNDNNTNQVTSYIFESNVTS